MWWRKITKEEFSNFISDKYDIPYLFKYKIKNSWFLSTLTLNRNYYNEDDLLIGHPLNLKTKFISCGLSRKRKNDFINDVSEIRLSTTEDLEIWTKYYLRFHNQVALIKGYDSCEEDLSNIRITIVYEI